RRVQNASTSALLRHKTALWSRTPTPAPQGGGGCVPGAPAFLGPLPLRRLPPPPAGDDIACPPCPAPPSRASIVRGRRQRRSRRAPESAVAISSRGAEASARDLRSTWTPIAPSWVP